MSFIGEYEKAITRYAEPFGVTGVLCGHIHSASIRLVGSLQYFNCGDWVENCTALVENHDGRIELLNTDPFVPRGQFAESAELEAVAP